MCLIPSRLPLWACTYYFDGVCGRGRDVFSRLGTSAQQSVAQIHDPIDVYMIMFVSYVSVVENEDRMDSMTE